MVSFTLRQVTAIVDGPAYQVSSTVEAATNASPAVFVYAAIDQAFSHYAAVADMDQWPDTYEIAVVTGALFYRLPTLVRTWDTVAEMERDLADTLRRVRTLQADMTARVGDLVIDRTTVIAGG